MCISIRSPFQQVRTHCLVASHTSLFVCTRENTTFLSISFDHGLFCRITVVSTFFYHVYSLLYDRRVELVSLVVMATYEVVVIVVTGVVDRPCPSVAAVVAAAPVVVCRRGRGCCGCCCCSRVGPPALSPAVLSLGVLLGLHPPVLEPDLDLSLC